MAVHALVTGLIVFRILKVFLEVNATMTSVERTFGSSGGTKFRHAIFVIVESGMVLFAIQMLRVVVSIYYQKPTPEAVDYALNFVAALNGMFNVIIRSVHFLLFCVLITFSWVGYRTNNNFGAGLNEFVLRRQRILLGSCRKSSF